MHDDLRADMILAQEVSAGGVPDRFYSEWTVLEGVKGQLRKTWNWGSVIAARKSLQLRARMDLYSDPWLAQLYDLVLVGDISIDGNERIAVASVHTAAMSVEDWIRQYAISLALTPEELSSLRRPDCNEHPYINDFAFAVLQRLLGPRFFVGGDWNTCRQYDGGLSFFDRAREAGWITCHGEREIPTYSGRSGVSYQLDHAFCDSKTFTSKVAASVVDNEIVRSLSDHAPLIVDIDTSLNVANR